MHTEAPCAACISNARRMPRPNWFAVTSGAIFDVLLDLRHNSATYCHWRAAELTEDNGLALYVPAGFAHGFQSLADDTAVLYQITERHAPDFYVGLRWDDPAFGIRWPVCPPILSEQDAAHKDFDQILRRPCPLV